MRSFMTTAFLCLSVGLLTAAVGLPPHEVPAPGTARLTVLAHGPAGLAIEGKSTAISFDADEGRLLFTVQPASLDTGIELRNRHLRELLEVEQFPRATLEVTRTTVEFPRAGRATEGTAAGVLTLHGIARPVPVQYRAQRAGDGSVLVEGTVLIDLPDYGLRAPAYLGISVAPQVKVVAELSLEQR